jgi:hypothetical protein
MTAALFVNTMLRKDAAWEGKSMATQDNTFYAVGSTNPNDITGVTAWSTSGGNIPFDQGVLGFGLMRGVIGLVDTGTTAPPSAPPAVSYTAKVGTFGGANTDTGVAGVRPASASSDKAATPRASPRG